MVAFCEIWKICSKVLIVVTIGLGVLHAQSDIPYGKTVRDSIEWSCCFSEGEAHFVLEDTKPWEFVDYRTESWACCFIEPALRRYEIMRIQGKIRKDSLNRAWKALADLVDAAFFKSFPVVGPKKTDNSAKAYNCYKLGDGSEMCGHVSE